MASVSCMGASSLRELGTKKERDGCPSRSLRADRSCRCQQTRPLTPPARHLAHCCARRHDPESPRTEPAPACAVARVPVARTGEKRIMPGPRSGTRRKKCTDGCPRASPEHAAAVHAELPLARRADDEVVAGHVREAAEIEDVGEAVAAGREGLVATGRDGKRIAG